MTLIKPQSGLPEDYIEALRAEAERVSRDILADARRRVLVVGGGGYIGTVLIGHLLDQGYAVRSLDLYLYGTEPLLAPFADHPDFEAMTGDHCDDATVETALSGISDVVILSGLVGDPITKRYPDASQEINYDGMLRFIGNLKGRGLNKVVFISTCSNYGLIGADELADENFELNPLSLYATAKVAMEETLLALRDQVDYHATALRFATAFGLSPRMRFDLTISQFTRDMFLGRDMLVYDAATWRPYCHLQDFCEVIRRVLEAPVEQVSFEVFNAGGDVNNFTKQMIVDSILEFLPDVPVRYQEHGEDPRNYRVDFSKIRKILYFEPQFSVGDGIRELIAALKDGRFDDVDDRRNFYGNYEIAYEAP